MMREAEVVCVMERCLTVGLRWDDRESEPWVLDWYKRSGYKEKEWKRMVTLISLLKT